MRNANVSRKRTVLESNISMPHNSMNRPEVVPVGEERATRASEALCRACNDTGIRVSSWSDFKAWQDYVDGSIDEPRASEDARKELERYSDLYGKYVVIDKENPLAVNEEAEKKKRAKRANRIYQNVCRNAGLTMCFFNDFTAWSDYIQGKIGEEDLMRKAAEEVSGIRDEPALV